MKYSNVKILRFYPWLSETVATFSTYDSIAATSRESNLISISFLTWGLIAATSIDMTGDLEATPISSANMRRYGLMKSPIHGRLRGSERISK